MKYSHFLLIYLLELLVFTPFASCLVTVIFLLLVIRFGVFFLATLDYDLFLSIVFLISCFLAGAFYKAGFVMNGVQVVLKNNLAELGR